MKVSELTGDDLAFWTGRAMGYEYAIDNEKAYKAFSGSTPILTRDADGKLILQDPSVAKLEIPWRPHEDWAQGGPLIDGWNIFISSRAPGLVIASLCSSESEPYPDVEAEGATTLQAICRLVVRAEFGDDVPQEAQ